MGLGVDTRPFLVQTLEGSVEAARDGARDGTLDTGAETDMWSDGGKDAEEVGLAGSEVCVSISRAPKAAAGEPLWKLLRSSESRWIGSSRTSWTTAWEVGSGVCMVWWLTWLV